MPRNYRKKVGGRPYRNYTKATLNEALNAISTGLSIRKASKTYDINKSTLTVKYKAHREHINGSSTSNPISPCEPGRKTVLTPSEEKIICSHIVRVADFGFPVDRFELRSFVKGYLDSLGRNEPRFQNTGNMPGKDWADAFVKRHKDDISEKMSQSIRRYRAALKRQSLNEYFDYLGAELDDIPPSNIWNYDEINLQDDPGSNNVLVQRSAKHPGINGHATDSATSIITCGNAEGGLAPMYVVYKAEGLYQGWTQGGPPGAHYNHSNSGWLDSRIFEDWFEFTMLPLMKKQTGTKVLIGNNHNTHLNVEVLTLCQQNDIKFIALPAHSKQLLQPLEVSFYKMMEAAWRQIMDEWKEIPEGRRSQPIPKAQFPALLSRLVDTLKPNVADNLKFGFRETGIYPLNRNIILSKLRSRVQDGTRDNTASAAFVTDMESTRQARSGRRTSAKKMKVNVLPKKGITSDDLKKARGSGPAHSSGDPKPLGSVNRGKKTKRGRSSSNNTKNDPSSKKKLVQPHFQVAEKAEEEAPGDAAENLQIKVEVLDWDQVPIKEEILEQDFLNVCTQCTNGS